MQGVNVSIDRLTLVGFKLNNELEKILSDPTFDLIGNRYRAPYPYEWRFELLGGGLLEIGSLKTQSDIRLDFNPNSIKTERHKEMLKSLIAIMKYAKPTRIDIAMDIDDIDINDYAIVDRLARKTNLWLSGVGKLETYYIGAPTSDLRIRIYNKALEQGQEGKKWRIESQLRREFAENYSKFNPFDDITLVPKSVDLSKIKGFKEKVFIRHLLNNVNDLGQLQKDTRSKYKKILHELADSNSKEINFHNVYEDYKTTVVDIFDNYIEKSLINNLVWLYIIMKYTSIKGGFKG